MKVPALNGTECEAAIGAERARGNLEGWGGCCGGIFGVLESVCLSAAFENVKGEDGSLGSYGSIESELVVHAEVMAAKPDYDWGDCGWDLGRGMGGEGYIG